MGARKLLGRGVESSELRPAAGSGRNLASRDFLILGALVAAYSVGGACWEEGEGKKRRVACGLGS